MRVSRTSSARLGTEILEDRLTPSWGSTPPSTVALPSSFTAVALNTSGDATGTAAISGNETDWYKVTVPAGTVVLSATTPSSSLDTVIGLYSSAGRRVASNDDIAYPSNTDSRVSVTLAAGTYYLGVTNYTGTPGGAYTWAIDGPAVSPPPPPAPADDAYENNDTQATAYNLGTVSAARTVSGLVMADAADWYRFTTTTAGTGGSVSISFTNTQGNLDLRLVNSAGTVVATSAGTGNTETVSLNGLAAGTYSVQVYGVNGALNPNYALTVTPPTVPPPPPPTTGGFSITLRTTGLTASQQAIFQQAADRWAQVIVGDLPNATYGGVAVDDLLIDASGAAIDGAGGVLGQAGPDSLRSGSRLPIHGSMQFDTADLASLEASGGLYYTVLHEMGHVLGIGTIWSTLGLISGAGGSDPRFTGAQATAAYNSIFGTSATSVPVENTGGAGTRDGHWRETVFRNEVMTGYLNSGVNPLSRVTVAALADMGYVVSMTSADAFTPTGTAALTSGSSGTTGGLAGLQAATEEVAATPAVSMPAPAVTPVTVVSATPVPVVSAAPRGVSAPAATRPATVAVAVRVAFAPDAATPPSAPVSGSVASRSHPAPAGTATADTPATTAATAPSASGWPQAAAAIAGSDDLLDGVLFVAV